MQVRAADAARWQLLLGRPVAIRSAELHVYQPGGGVVDPQHRDAGSLLTLSVLLTPPEAFTGGSLTLARTDRSDSAGRAAVTAAVHRPELSCGDGVLFTSEKRHNVSHLQSGERRTFILELWEGGANQHNRHK